MNALSITTRPSFEERLREAADRAGIRPARGGSWKANVGKQRVVFSILPAPDGWLLIESKETDRTDEQLLREHANWAGPVKLQRGNGSVTRVVELPLGEILGESQAAFWDDQADRAVSDALIEVLRAVPRWLTEPKQEKPDREWPPSVTPEHVADWLQDGGYEPTHVGSEEVRLVVKRSGWDGEVRIQWQGEGRLRASMSLGRWPRLAPDRRQAMIRLASEANARCRLCRIAIPAPSKQESGGPLEQRRLENAEAEFTLEAQVDLTGLPAGSPDQPVLSSFWREMVLSVVDGFALNLNRLALELDALSQNESLAQIVLCGPMLSGNG